MGALLLVLVLALMPVLVQVLALAMLLMLMTGEGGLLEGLLLLRAREGSVTDTAGGSGSCSAWQTRHRQLVSVALAGLLTTGRRNLAYAAQESAGDRSGCLKSKCRNPCSSAGARHSPWDGAP